MAIRDALLADYDHEMGTTRRLLERLPDNRLEWKPHDKSMSLGKLAQHVATAPAFLSDWAVQDVVTMAGGAPSDPTSTAEILAAHDAGASKTKENIGKIGDSGLGKMWEIKGPDGKTMMSMPKSELLRSLVMNHTYHHRGQLSVYLRLLDVPVPSIYGPSADENPWTK
jgi:uncharacterized damage-inducible protein DinB